MSYTRYGFGGLFHITHISNVRSILAYGLHPHGNPYQNRDISNHEVNDRREKRDPFYNRKIHDYVPFYFNPRNAMLYRNKDTNVVILKYSMDLLEHDGILISDRNAASKYAKFYNYAGHLSSLDWNSIKSQSWYGDDNLKQKMMAEALYPDVVPGSYIKAVKCKNHYQKEALISMGIPEYKIDIDRWMFFKCKSKYAA